MSQLCFSKVQHELRAQFSLLLIHKFHLGGLGQRWPHWEHKISTFALVHQRKHVSLGSLQWLSIRFMLRLYLVTMFEVEKNVYLTKSWLPVCFSQFLLLSLCAILNQIIILLMNLEKCTWVLPFNQSGWRLINLNEIYRFIWAMICGKLNYGQLTN